MILCIKMYRMHILCKEDFDKLICLSAYQVLLLLTFSTLWSTVHLWYQQEQTLHISKTFRCNFLLFQGHKVKMWKSTSLRPEWCEPPSGPSGLWFLLCHCWEPEALICNWTHLFALCFWYVKLSEVWSSSCPGLRISPALVDNFSH